MGLLKKLFGGGDEGDKAKKKSKHLFEGFVYIVDMPVFRAYLEREVDFSVENDLEAAADLNIYIGEEKHHIETRNYAASRTKSDREKGVVIYFDDSEFRTIDELINQKLHCLPTYFKIELLLGDDVGLNEYRDSHPELTIE